MKKNNEKFVSILSYITIIGWVIAFIINRNKKTDLGSFHQRQALIIIIAGLIASYIPTIGWLLGIIVFVLWVMGLVYAIQGKKKEIPLIGSLAQKWFKGL